MIFGIDNDFYQVRYETYEQAMEGHRIALELVKNRTTKKVPTLFKGKIMEPLNKENNGNPKKTVSNRNNE